MNHFLNFKLQLFADPNTQTTETSSPSNDLSAEMKTFYSRKLLESAKPNLVHLQFGEPGELPKNGGKTVEWRKWSSFKKALKPLTEGVTPDGTPVNVGYVTATVKEYGDYTTVSDVLELTAIDDVIGEITTKHGDNAGLTLDTVVRNELNTNTNVIFAPVVSGSSVTPVTARHKIDDTSRLTTDLIAKAVTRLKKVNAPKINGSYVCIIHPSVSYDLMTNPDWIDVHKYADAKSIYNGEIGSLYGVRFVESTEAKIFYGEDLRERSRNLTVYSYSNKKITVHETLTLEDAAALIGRQVLIDGILYDITDAGASSATDTAYIKVDDAPESNYPAANDIICPGEGGKVYTDADGEAQTYAVYSCLFLGKGAYKYVNINGTETIVKQKGSAGTADPLNQRSTVGWKNPGFVAKTVLPEYIVRVECGSSFSQVDKNN